MISNTMSNEVERYNFLPFVKPNIISDGPTNERSIHQLKEHTSPLSTTSQATWKPSMPLNGTSCVSSSQRTTPYDQVSQVSDTGWLWITCNTHTHGAAHQHCHVMLNTKNWPIDSPHKMESWRTWFVGPFFCYHLSIQLIHLSATIILSEN